MKDPVKLIKASEANCLFSYIHNRLMNRFLWGDLLPGQLILPGPTELPTLFPSFGIIKYLSNNLNILNQILKEIGGFTLEIQPNNDESVLVNEGFIKCFYYVKTPLCRAYGRNNSI